MSGEDANPLNRRLPAEVITRQSKVKKVIEKISDDVQVDLKVALSLKPEARLRWLSKAFKMVEEKKVPGTELYDIVSNRKFCGTMQSKNSQKLRAIVAESMAIFSDKQQRFLRSSGRRTSSTKTGKPTSTAKALQRCPRVTSRLLLPLPELLLTRSEETAKELQSPRTMEVAAGLGRFESGPFLLDPAATPRKRSLNRTTLRLLLPRRRGIRVRR